MSGTVGGVESMKDFPLTRKDLGFQKGRVPDQMLSAKVSCIHMQP